MKMKKKIKKLIHYLIEEIRIHSIEIVRTDIQQRCTISNQLFIFVIIQLALMIEHHSANDLKI